MYTTLPIVGIDIRLIGKQRTGDEVVFFNLTRALLQKGKGQFYFHLFTHEKEETKLVALRTQLECLGREDVKFVSVAFGKNRFLWNMLALPLQLFRQPVDIYHTQYIAPLFLPSRVKLVTHIHDVSFAAHPEWIAARDRFFLNLLIPRSLHRSDKIIAPSQFTKNEIEIYYPYTQGKVSIVPNAAGREWMSPVPVEEVEKVQKKYGLPERYIIASGTMQPRKNIPLLVEAWAKRPEELRDIGLVLTGNRFGHHVDVRLHDPKVIEEIIFPGYVDLDMLRVLVKGASVSVFPSLYEGFGIPLLEAFASRVPVLASRIAPFQEVGGGGFLSFDPLNIDEMKKNLYSLLIDRDVQQRLIQAGEERIRLFSWEKSAEVLLTEYRTLLT